MRARTVVVSVVVIAGLGVAAYGIVPLVASAIVPTTTTTTTLPPGTPVGFNAARTEFVLPHNLGLLPTPELALAKADPAYASGLENAGYWTQTSVQVPSKSNTGPNVMVWGYVGATSFPIGTTLMSGKTSAWGDAETYVVSGEQPVGPSALEILAAPIGTVSVKGVQLPAFCVPMPSGLQGMTSAGPSTVFAETESNQPTTYDKGVVSCNNFH